MTGAAPVFRSRWRAAGTQATAAREHLGGESVLGRPLAK